MSLRLRLLVAVGLIAIVALVVADFATYSALRSSLYQQVDQELAQQPHRLPGNQATGFSCPVAGEHAFGGQDDNGAGPGGGRVGGRRLPQRLGHQLHRRGASERHGR